MKTGFLAGLTAGLLVAVAGFVVWDVFLRDHAGELQPSERVQLTPPDPGEASSAAGLATTSPRAPAADPALAQTAMWTVTDPPLAELPRKRIDVEESGVLRFDRVTLTSLKPGDTTTIVLPDPAHSVSLTIEKVTTTKAGNRQIAGRLTGSRLHPFLLTLSAGSMFATVGTPVGTYNLRGGETHAWVFTGASLNQHVDPSQPDYRVPPERAKRPPATPTRS